MTGQRDRAMAADAPGLLRLLVRKARSAVRLARHHGDRARTRLVNLTLKQARHYGMRWARVRRIVAEKSRNAVLLTINLSRLSARRALNLRKPFIRLRKRGARAREQDAARRLERGVDRRIRAVVRGRRPLIVGPWFSEVGFEVLYWVPFLRWIKAHHNLDPTRVVVVSRGGVASWYRDIGATYVEIFDCLDPATFARKNQSRREAGDGSHKQLALSDLDREILALVEARLGLSGARVCHPSLMYLLFRNFWLGHRPLSHVEERTRFTRLDCPDEFDLSGLPRDYVAVKAYTAQSLPDTPANRAILRDLVNRLAERIDVVTLDTGLVTDDHDDYLFDRHPRVRNLADLMRPQNNLGLQTQVITRARAFVGTCGSLTWLAPMLGVPTVALMSDPRFLHPHLYFARKAYLEAGAATFATVDLKAVEYLNLESLVDEGHPGQASAAGH